MSENFRPLNDEDINRLDELLATSSSLDDTFDVSMLDGYLSAVALLNPAPEDESVWYPYIFNETGTEVTIDEPQTVHTLIVQRLREIRAFQAKREFYNPIIFPLENDDGKPLTGKDGLPALTPWATGFYNALAQFEDRVGVTDDVEAALCNIHRFLELDPDDEDYAEQAAIRKAIEETTLVNSLEQGMVTMIKGVLEIARLNCPKVPVRNTAKIGRNDPCPCGSGKKYKQCCGKNA